MPRQARSEATRRKIIDSAVDLINEIGYPAAGLGDIIERAELTKGALYYHFDSKEALATAIIDEGAEKILGAFRTAGDHANTALEKAIQGSFLVGELLTGDRVVRAGARLLRTFGGFNPSAKKTLEQVVAEMVGRVRTAAADGDVRPGTDVDTTAAGIVAGLLGAELLSSALADGADMRRRFVRAWELLLPAVVVDGVLAHYLGVVAQYD
jgi:AcrR family transcriptional regulator